MNLIEPVEFKLACQDGKERVYVLSKVPAVEGREILAKYTGSAIPKMGDYGINEEMMLKLMSYVSAKDKENKDVRLSNQTLINNHVRTTMDLMKLEDQMFFYNYGFFLREKVLNLFDAILQMVKEKLQEMSMASLRPSSLPERPLSTN